MSEQHPVPERSEPDIEATPEDAAEQSAEVVEPEPEEPIRVPFDADEADAAEQHQVVEVDEDDYR